ncbi:hypothetical protein, partial [Niastella populi]|uniref:TubC N-terminal docking domain-related protein n=1 Tax=Niastella populi TaxID=550983 RepID=UPI0010564A02
MKSLLKKLRDHKVHVSLNGPDLLVSSNEAEIPQSIFDEIKLHKHKIIEYLKINIINEADKGAIIPVAPQASYPLSFSQRRL